MKIHTEPLESSQVLLEIEVDPPRVERAVDQAYRRLAGRMNVPGFRRGKAPRPLVERMIGRESLLEDAIEHLVPEVYREAVGETGLDPIEEASFQVVETEPLRIKATVPVRPEVQLGDYRSLRRELSVAEVTAEQVDAVLDQLRDSHATWAPVERPVQLEDRVALDVHGLVGERVLVDRHDVEYTVREGSSAPMPGFAEALVGLAPGEQKEFTLHLPDDYEDQELAGQDVAFDVKVHWVKEKHLPELDDAFAASVGSFATVAELREHAEGELRSRAEATARRELEDAVVDAVVGVAQLELPPQAITRQSERLRQRLASSLDKQGLTLEQYRQLLGKSAVDLDEEFTNEARRDLTRAFVLGAITDAEQIAVVPDEIEAEIRQAAGSGPDAARVARAALARPETRERVEAVIKERKTVQRLVALATGEESPEAAAAAASEERSDA